MDTGSSSGNAATKLSKMIHTTTCVERLAHGKQEVALEDVRIFPSCLHCKVLRRFFATL